MKKNSRLYNLIAALIALVAVSLHSYLASEHYKLKLGESAGKSLCDLNATFNCAAVAASDYSTILGIPIAVFGAWTNFALLIFLLLAALLGREGEAWRRYGLWLSSVTVIGSLIMGFISISYMTVYCPFCIALYVLSLLIFALTWLSLQESPLPRLKDDVVSIAKGHAGAWILILLIPVGSWIVNFGAYKKVGGQKQMELAIQEQLAIWRSSPFNEFDTTTALSTGPKDSQVQIVEFADLRCGHCREAAPRLELFARSHPDVVFHFFLFPLDGDCNEAISRSSGISCRLAKVLYCVGAQDPQRGHQLKSWIFEHQDQFTSMASVDDGLEAHFAELNLDWAQTKSCAEDQQTHEIIAAQAKQGAKAQIQGTPTIFVNGRQLPGGQMLPVLEAAYEKAKSDAR